MNNTSDKRLPLSWFLEDMRKYKWVVVEIIVIALLLRVLTIVIPFSFQTIIDKIIPYSRYYSLYFMLGVFLSIAFVQAYFTFATFITTQYLSIKLIRGYANKFYKHLFCLPPRWHYSWRTGDILARIGEMTTIQNFITKVIFGISLDIIFIVFYVVILFMINGKLTLVFLSILPIQMLLFFITGPLLRSRVQESFQARANMESTVVENLTTVETVKALSLEQYVLDRFNAPFDISLRAGYRLSLLQHILGQLLGIVSKLREALVIIVGAYFILKGGGEFTVGMLIAFYLISEQIVAPLQGIAGIWESFQHVRVSRKRLGDILVEETEDLSETPLPKATSDLAFNAKDIRFSWDEKLIFEGLNFTVASGDFIGIAGPSGAGKTTLAKIIAGLLQSDHGVIEYYGHDIQTLPMGTYRRQVAYIPAKSDIFRGSVKVNLNPYQFDYSPEDYQRALKAADAGFVFEELPDGLDTIIGEGALSLSTGQQQRLIVARALLSKAKVLIFDEPTAALDEKSSHHIISSLKDMCAQGYTVFVITHDQSLKTYFKKVIAFAEAETAEGEAS